MKTLDLNKLQNVHSVSGRTIARCPACAEVGSDKNGDHLIIYEDGRFGCVLNPGSEGASHRKRIMDLAGSDAAESTFRSGWRSLDEASQFFAETLKLHEKRRDIYQRHDGLDHFVVIRFDGVDRKEYRPFWKTPSGWIAKDPPGKLPLFRLPDITTRTRERVFIVEGEKCACEIITLGIAATTSAHGAKAAHKTDWSPLAGREVVILPDNDAEGLAYAETVAKILNSLSPPATIKIVHLPDLPPKGDCVDWLEAREASLPEEIRAELERFIDSTPGWNSENREPISLPALLPENDAGNAEIFINRFGNDLRFVPSYDEWLIWNGARWGRDNDGGIQRLAVQLSREMFAEAGKIIDHKERTAVAERAFRLGNIAKIKPMLELAKCTQRVVTSTSTLDADPWSLGVYNGVVDLRTGMLRSGSKDDLVTKAAGCHYDPGSQAPRWQQFLREIFGGSEDLIDYVQKLFGYSLTGVTTEQVFAFLYGSGANGKTTLIETITAAAGDYAQRASQALLVSRDNGHEPMNEIARLHGARLVIGTETREGDRLAENRIKDMTGGDTMTGRFLYREPFDFVPQLKLWMFGNHRPEIRSTDYGIWRRVSLIPFNVRIHEDQRDRFLVEKLRLELPGILNWGIKGCLRWQREGLKAPNVIRAATAEYRDEEDVLLDFLRDEIENDNASRLYHAELYKRYLGWCENNGVRFPMQTKTLSKRLNERGYRHERIGRGVRWAGMKLKCSE